MLIVLVNAKVKPECIEAFKTASEDNARCSNQEQGIAQFALIQQAEDPCRFVLIEAYRNAQAPALHKETAHYARWRDAVAPMMAEPRSSVKYETICPTEADWNRRA